MVNLWIILVLFTQCTVNKAIVKVAVVFNEKLFIIKKSKKFHDDQLFNLI